LVKKITNPTMTGREAIGQRSETVRRANLSAIISELHLRGPQSRSELVARTGLTRSAIRGLVGELSAAGLVAEERSSSIGMPGRPSPLARPRHDRVAVLALEIAVDSLSAAVVGLGGNVIELVRADRARGHLDPERIVADLARLARPLLATRTPESVVGIGVSIVGVVRASDGMVRVAPNLGWQDVPLAEVIARRLRLSLPLAVANDADLGALAEHRRGAAAGIDDVLFIAGEVGVGGGVIVAGRPLAGASGYAGEIGHMPVNPSGSDCRCGSTGCWETEVGERAFLQRAGERPTGGRTAVDAVFAAAQAGSPRARDALAATGSWLGIGLAGLANVFNPSLIVLGGLFGRMHPFVSAQIEEAMDRGAMRAPREALRVVPAVLGMDAPLLGAAELAFEPLLADPAGWLAPRPALVRYAGA
jgi:predicted NBD/HSP70 family sugar kinase